MSGKTSRNKGARGERELFALLSDRLGFAVTRNLGQTRDAGCDTLSIPGFTIECKRVESGFQAGWMAQAVAAMRAGFETPVVFYRRSRCPWRAAFRLSDLLQSSGYTGLAHVNLDDAATIIRERLS